MVLAIRQQERMSAKPLDNRVSILRSAKPLKQFLEDQAGGKDRFTLRQGSGKESNLGLELPTVAAKRQRPNAGIDDEIQSRERSLL